MSITIRVGNKANRKTVTLEMDVRKSIAGDLMIFDHGDIESDCLSEGSYF